MKKSLETYLLREDSSPDDTNSFFKIGSLDGRMELKKNSFYHTGVLRILEGNNEFLGFEYWDLIDQLWFYFVNAISESLKEGYSQFYFPDQPVLIAILKIPGGVQVSKEDAKISFTKLEILEVIIPEAKRVFGIFKEEYPDNFSYSEALDQILPELEELLRKL